MLLAMSPRIQQAVKVLTSLATALIGGYVFRLLHIPIPWMLGPMIAVLIGSSIFKDRYRWPGQFRNVALGIVGYTIGLSLTAAALHQMAIQLPSMIGMTVLLMLLCGSLAYLVSKVSGVNFKTSLLGSIPGGLTQMVILAEETEGINLTIVTITQVIRLMMIVVCVPLLVFSPIMGNHRSDVADAAISAASSASWSGLFPNILLFAAVSAACALLGDRIKFPTAFFLGPALGTAALQLLGVHGPPLPSLLICAAQVMIGVNVGLMLKPGQLDRKLQTISLAIVSGLLLVIGSFGLSALFASLQPVTQSTALLSLAPGGMDQMGIIAHEIGADLSIVAGYQVFRTFFIFFAVPPLLRLFFKYSASQRAPRKKAT